MVCAIALQVESDRTRAIAGLGQVLEALSDAQRSQLVACAIALPEADAFQARHNKTQAITGLAEGLQKLYESADPST